MRKVIGSIVAAALAVTGFIVVAPNASAAGTYTVSIADASASEGAGVVTHVVTVSPTLGAGDSFTVACSTTSGTATETVDFNDPAATLTFNPGDTTQNCNVPLIEDAAQEPSEVYNANLAAPVQVSCVGVCNFNLGDPQAQGTIVDNDGGVGAISVNDPTDPEGTGGAQFVDFLISSSTVVPAGCTYSVQFATQDGTAQSGTDYNAFSGTATIPSGGQSIDIFTTTIPDSIDEPDETFFLNLTNPTVTGPCLAPTIADAQGEATIEDDDGTDPDPTGTDVSISDGVPFKATPSTDCTFEVTRTGDTSAAASVDYATQDGTAKAGKHYAAESGTVNFAAGDASETIVIDVLKKGRARKPLKTFNVVLSNPVGIDEVADGSGTCTLKRKKPKN